MRQLILGILIIFILLDNMEFKGENEMALTSTEQQLIKETAESFFVYGKHLDMCPIPKGQSIECRCGFDKAKENAKKTINLLSGPQIDIKEGE